MFVASRSGFDRGQPLFQHGPWIYSIPNSEEYKLKCVSKFQIEIKIRTKLRTEELKFKFILKHVAPIKFHGAVTSCDQSSSARAGSLC